MADARWFTVPSGSRARQWTGQASRPFRLKPVKAFDRDRIFWILTAWLVFVFLLGGGSRGDIASLMILRPASVLVLAYGLGGLTAEQIRANRFLLGLAFAWLALLILHLVPLPPAIWQALPGRDGIQEIDRAAGLGEQWRPLTMVPYATRNALWATMAPLSVLVLGVQLDARQRARLVPLVLILGSLSAFLALLQILGDSRGPLYFYRITNYGSAVGLFANRNHQAVLLAILLPVLLFWARMRSEDRRKGTHRLLAMAGAVALIPLILITGSRSGMIIALLALLLLPAILWDGTAPRRNGRDQSRKWRIVAWLFPLCVVALVALSLMLDRALAVDRLISSDAAQEMRLRILPILLSLIGVYMPWGSGIGTFEQIYRVHEPDALLAPFYMNHAHNDWLELALTGGVPALMLAAVAIAAFFVTLVRLAASTARSEALLLARLGMVIVLIFALASLSDYPLRVPSLACLAAIAALWAGSGRCSQEIDREEKRVRPASAQKHDEVELS